MTADAARRGVNSSRLAVSRAFSCRRLDIVHVHLPELALPLIKGLLGGAMLPGCTSMVVAFAIRKIPTTCFSMNRCFFMPVRVSEARREEEPSCDSFCNSSID